MPVQASSPGVTYDPGSPAGKEYAIPFVQGRAQGAGTSNEDPNASIPFGVGIKPPGSGGGSGSGKATQRGPRGAHGRHGASGVGKPGGGSASTVSGDQRLRLLQAEDAGGTGLWTIGIGLAVLLPAALLAALLRRRPERPAG